MQTVLTIILFLLLLTIIICIHEFGHLIAAKIFKVYCFEYSFGMGPPIFRKKTKETTYSIRALPIGGFVAMAGEAEGDEAYPDVEVPEGRRLTDQAAWKKIIIMLAGVFMNFVLCWVILSVIFLYSGYASVSPEAIIESVQENSPAERAGFESGDIIQSITTEDGVTSHPDTYEDMQYFLASNEDNPVTFEVLRDDQIVSITVTPEYNETYGSYMIGISGPTGSYAEVNIINCWYYGFDEMITIVKAMGSAIRRIFTASGVSQLSGPVGIYNVTAEAASMGALTYIFLIAELSLNVGLFNLLPLPILDGGQVVITLCEAIARRPLNQKVKNGITVVCWLLLLGLMVFVTWNDITKLIF